MSNERVQPDPIPPTATAQAPEAGQAPVSAAPAPAADKLDSVEEIDFLLEEIESKIAPLALA